MSASQKSKSQVAFEQTCMLLDFAKDNGLVINPSDTDDDYLRQTLEEARKKLDINAIFFLKPEEGGPRAPLIYFRLMESKDTSKIAELHKLSWNMGQAPLLFIVLPDSVLVYNNLAPPRSPLDDKAGLIRELKVFSSLEEEIREIRQFRRAELETGNFWHRTVKIFQIENGVFRMLLKNLDVMRKKLVMSGLHRNLVYPILIRALFVKYLEDRRDNQDQGVFPTGFFGQFLTGASCFTDLLADKKSAYKFFEYLSKKFNGDVFVVDKNEEDAVTQEHLSLLQRMLMGEEHLETRQMVLWPLYSFDVIPVELISSIYEQFLRLKTDKEEVLQTGIHYTPYHLVEFLMDQVMPGLETGLNFRILDPACGSGIFLVEGYRRLVAGWRKANNYSNPSASELVRLLTENVFGVDLDENAIRIAALSLHLTLCDYLEPKTIWNEVRFAPLRNHNLFVDDFFNSRLALPYKKFDLIVGNPPWESRLSKQAERYVDSRRFPIGDRQICQAFLWKVAELCSPGGTACMIVSSKALLFNRSPHNSQFRNKFFSRYEVKQILNFSALRHLLFSNAVGPGAAIIFSPTLPTETESILYRSPKPSYTLQDELSFVIEPQDIAHIPLTDALESEVIWKVSMWGSPRDYELVQKLSEHQKLRDVTKKRGWIDGEGYIVGNKRHITKALLGKPEVTAGSIERFVVKKESLRKCEKDRFERSRSKKRQIYQGPHLLVKQSPQAGYGFISAVMIEDSVFPQTILGIHSDGKYLNDLISICQALNSDLFLYYAMLTSGRWLVERDELEKKEIMSIPIPEEILNRNINFDFLSRLAKDDDFRRSENDKLMRLYGIDNAEKALIQDAIEFTLDYFHKGRSSKAIESPSESSVTDYLRILCEILNNQFASAGSSFRGTVYLTKAPLRMISLKLSSDRQPMVTEERNEEETERVLTDLDRHLIEEESRSIYVRRHLRRYSRDSVYIIKPNQARCWTRSSAIVDADQVYADIMRDWRPAP